MNHSIMSALKFGVIAASVCLMSACAVAPVQESQLGGVRGMLADDAFRKLALPVKPEQVFELTPEMIEFTRTRIEPQARRLGIRRALMDALYEHSELLLRYDAEYTRTAAQAFHERRGNCLSLVIMTAAIARSLEVPVRIRSVYVDEVWTRSKDLSFVTGHVNLTLAPRVRDSNWLSTEPDVWSIDFEPETRAHHRRVVELSDSTVIAMFMNNRAAESLNRDELDEAYWWAREAMLAEPRYLAAFNTMGVVYRRHGQLDKAETVLKHVLSVEPSNAQALSNLAVVLAGQSREVERQQLLTRLSELQPVPPFKFLDDGIAAMRRGDFVAARALFDKELARSAFSDEAHFWRALASYALRDARAAAEHLRRAADASPTLRQRGVYEAKLASIEAEQRKARRLDGGPR